MQSFRLTRTNCYEIW